MFAFLLLLTTLRVMKWHSLAIFTPLERILTFRRDLLNHDTIAMSAWLARQQ